jgi:hypothetical protein
MVAAADPESMTTDERRLEVADIAAELAALDGMATSELAERYAELHGQPCRPRLRRTLSRQQQARARP